MDGNAYGLDAISAFIANTYAGYNVVLFPDGYNVTFTALAPGVTATQTINISGNSDFVMIGAKYRAGLGTTAQSVSSKTAAFARMLLTDAGSNEQFTKQAIDLENYSTNGGDSRMLPYPRVLQSRTAVTVQVSNYSATETYGLDIYFEGVQVKILGAAKPGA